MATQMELDSSPDLRRRMEYLRQFGNRSTSYFTLQPGLNAYFVDGKGYVAYQTFGRGWTTLKGLLPETFVLADPVAHSADKKTVLEKFVQDVGPATFLQVSEETASHLNNMGYTINQFGVELHIDIPGFDLRGPEKRNLRQTINSARRGNLFIQDVSNSEADPDAIDRVSETWRKSKKTNNRELRFLTRPFVNKKEIDVRRFHAFLDGELVGYVCLDPIYENGLIEGYTANIVRELPDTPSGVIDAIKIHALETFLAEKKKVLSLGYCPFAQVESVTAYKTNLTLKRVIRFTFYKANWVYSFKGLYFHKSRYGGREEKVYFATQSKCPALRLLQTLAVCDAL